MASDQDTAGVEARSCVYGGSPGTRESKLSPCENYGQRLRRGQYAAHPVKRIWIEKEGGKKRPIGITALEDKIVQKAAATLLNAGIVKTLGDYRWSSHQGYLSKTKKWSWLHKDELLGMLTTAKTKQKAAYINFVSKDEAKEIERFYSLKKLPAILGGESFKEFVKEKFFVLLNQPETPEAKVLLS